MSDKIIVLHRCDPKDTPVTLNVNGKVATIPNNTETSIPALFHDAALNCGFPIEILATGVGVGVTAEDQSAPALAAALPEAPADGEGAPGGDGGTDPAGAPFDADAVIAGNVATVAGRLSDLTLDQLDAVLAAEIDREQPRNGVKAAIEAEKQARAVTAAE